MKKVALVTAASKGMGLACAQELKKQGYDLAIMARGESILDVADELNAIGIQGSVTSTEDLKVLVDAAMNNYGRIDAVVNNTGHPPKGSLLELTSEDWHNGLDLIVNSVAEMTKLVVPYMKDGGSIVNISTFAAFEPNKNFPISSALRAALSGYTKLFAAEYGAKLIRMNNVLPGYIDSYEITSEIKQLIPLGRSGKVEEIAKTVAFLLSEDAKYITGENIKVDGGLTRGI